MNKSVKHTAQIERPNMLKRLKRVGCPVNKIPRFSSRQYYCEDKEDTVYHLADGTPCCRKAIGQIKTIGYSKKPSLAKPATKTIDKKGMTTKALDKKGMTITVILNPRTNRWVDINGLTGKEVLKMFYQ